MGKYSPLRTRSSTSARHIVYRIPFWTVSHPLTKFPEEPQELEDTCIPDFMPTQMPTGHPGFNNPTPPAPADNSLQMVAIKYRLQHILREWRKITVTSLKDKAKVERQEAKNQLLETAKKVRAQNKLDRKRNTKDKSDAIRRRDQERAKSQIRNRHIHGLSDQERAQLMPTDLNTPPAPRRDGLRTTTYTDYSKLVANTTMAVVTRQLHEIGDTEILHALSATTTEDIIDTLDSMNDNPTARLRDLITIKKSARQKHGMAPAIHNMVRLRQLCYQAHNAVKTTLDKVQNGLDGRNLPSHEPEAPDVYTPDPKGHKQMLAHPKSEEWLKATDSEMQKITEHESWTELPNGKHDVPKDTIIFRSMFIWNTKRFQDSGLIEKYKARLVVCGNMASDDDDDGINYAPTAEITTLRIIVALSIAQGLHMSSLDVANAFLHEDVNSDVYMSIPYWYYGKHTVVKLNKSLYGLKQAPRLFWEGMQQHLLANGYRQSDFDSCLFLKGSGNDMQYALVFVDDILVVSTNLDTNRKFKNMMTTKYAKVTWNDNVSTFIGLAFTQAKSGLVLNQPVYTRRLQAEYCPEITEFPDCPGRQKPKGNQEKDVDPKLIPVIRKMVGGLQFLANTRHDILTDLNKVARQMHHPTEDTYLDALHIIQYVSGTPDAGLSFQANTPAVLHAWVDASWLSEPNYTSRTGFCCSLGTTNAMFFSFSKAQTLASLSTQQSEIIALSECVRTVRYFQMLLDELGYPQADRTPIYEDNAATISFAHGRGDNTKTRHIGVKDRYAREAQSHGYINVVKIATDDHVADLLTKTLPPTLFQRHATTLLGMAPRARKVGGCGTESPK